MSSNSLGTVFRIGMIALFLLSLMFLGTSILYILYTILFGVEFSYMVLFLVFGSFLIFRMFYPKNVFNCD